MQDRVFAIVSQVFNEPLNKVNLESSPDTIEAWDSIKQINLVLALEQEFGVEFADEQLAEMFNVALIIEILKECGVQ
jgi:acyl carrier protein